MDRERDWPRPAVVQRGCAACLPIAEELVRVRGQLAEERAARGRAEADAYEHGLGDRGEVARVNRVLAATVAALVDRTSALRVNP